MTDTYSAIRFSPCKEQGFLDPTNDVTKMLARTTTQDRARMQITKSEVIGWGKNFGMEECEAKNVSLSEQKAATQTDGSIETFGKALTSNGLYGASMINPDNMSNNCVSVSIAKCLDFKNVKELWRHTYGCDLPDRPLRVHEIEDLIRRTGWDFHWVMHMPKEGKSAYDALLRQHYDLNIGFGAISVAAYLRTDGSGHCVVLNARGGTEPLCFQHSNDGQYIEGELKAATTIIVFYMRCPKNTMFYSDWQDRMLIRTMEEREKQRGWSIQKKAYQLYCRGQEPDKRCTFKRWGEVFQSLGISDEDEDDVGGAADSAEHGSKPKNRANGQVDEGEPHTVVRARL